MKASFQKMENPYFEAALQRMDLARQSAPVIPWTNFDPNPVRERPYLFGRVRDPVPGEVRAPGTRRQKESYFYLHGKRVNTGPSKRWSR